MIIPKPDRRGRDRPYAETITPSRHDGELLRVLHPCKLTARMFSKHGGGGGIRTPGGLAPTQPFQGCTIDHSDTPPVVIRLGPAVVPEEGLEPSRTCVRQILSLLRLPLRHSGKSCLGAGEGNRTLVASLEGWSSAIELRPLSQTNGRYYIISSAVKSIAILPTDYVHDVGVIFRNGQAPRVHQMSLKKIAPPAHCPIT